MDSDLETSHDSIFELNMEEIEYIPFYGEYKMTEAKKTAKKKVAVKQTEPQVQEEASVVEVITLGMVKEVEEMKPNVMAEVLKKATPEEIVEIVENMVVADVPEPGTTDVALSLDSVDVIRRGYTTIHMARAFRNTIKNSQDYLIVELRDVQNAILAYYVVHKSEEL